eukprot:Em0010g178a
MRVVRGRLIHSTRPEKVDILHDHLIGFDEDNGKILFVEAFQDLPRQAEKHGFDPSNVEQLTHDQFLIPGFVDTHIHAPQYFFTGTGYDLPLLQWLQKYTFPIESRFRDAEFARQHYPLAVKRSLRHGTTTACYFATIHLESCKELCKIIANIGQRALVGKVNMDQESPDHYVEDTQQSIDDTRSFVDFVKKMENSLVKPIITPRFAPTCSEKLLCELGKIAREENLHIQSHICEQKAEVKYTLDLFPSYHDCASIFSSSNLLTNKTVMAHCIYLSEEEIQMFHKTGVGVSHCPISNLCIKSGILDARHLLDRGVKIGLGTDVSGGYSSSILEAIRLSILSSKALSFSKPPEYKELSHHEAFYMGTLGGAKVLAMDDTIGNFEVGKQFDALVISTQGPHHERVFDVTQDDTDEDVFMKYLYLGDDRNISKIFVGGRERVVWKLQEFADE